MIRGHPHKKLSTVLTNCANIVSPFFAPVAAGKIPILPRFMHQQITACIFVGILLIHCHFSVLNVIRIQLYHIKGRK